MWRLIAKMLGNFLPTIVWRVLALLGLGVFSYVGMDSVKDFIFQKIEQSLGGITSDIVNIMALSGIDHYFTIVVSAYLSVFAVRSATKFIGVK